MREARAWWQPVELGPIGEAHVDVRGGLKEGDVILAEPEGAFAGMKVADPPGALPRISPSRTSASTCCASF